MSNKHRLLNSINQEEEELLLSLFSKEVEEKCLLFTLKGERRASKKFKEAINISLKDSKSKLEFLLQYLKENSTQTYHGAMYGISQAKVSEWVKFLLPVLTNALNKLKLLPQIGDKFEYKKNDKEILMVDVTEHPIPRKVDYEAQKEEYSGKKHYHTLKYLAICNQDKQILFCSSVYEGTTHDKKIWDDMSLSLDKQTLYADLGFVGIEKYHNETVMPFKKPKNKELTEDQKAKNKEIGSIRVKIEHAFSGVKTLRIVKDKIRLKTTPIREQVMLIAIGLHNLRMMFQIQKIATK